MCNMAMIMRTHTYYWMYFINALKYNYHIIYYALYNTAQVLVAYSTSFILISFINIDAKYGSLSQKFFDRNLRIGTRGKIF